MTWHNPRTNPPMRLIDVLIAVCGEEEAAQGFRINDDEWSFSTGHPVAASEVYAWAHMPTCPRQLEPEPAAPVADGRAVA